jgi:hypothetical protein
MQLPSTASVEMHESNHAASLLIDSWAPLSVTVDLFDAPNGTVGNVKPDYVSRVLDRDSGRILLKAILMPAAAEGDPAVHQFAWPINPEEWHVGNQKDAADAVTLCRYINLDHVGWSQMVYEVNRRANDRYYRTVVVEVAAELQRLGTVLQPELVEIKRRIDETIN